MFLRAIPEKVTSIGDMAFMCCNSLEEIKLPKNTTELNTMTFAYCTNLKSITIPEKMTNINTVVFAECKNLTKVSIPKKVTSIAEDAFDGCSKLTDIDYKGTKSQWKKVDIWSNVEPSDVIYKAAIHCKDGIVEPSILRPTQLKSLNSSKKSVKLTWKKTDYIKGYQIQISTDSKFKKNVKSGKKYYVRIRTYKGKERSDWSKVKVVTVK